MAYRAFSRFVLRSILVLSVCLPARAIHAHCVATIRMDGFVGQHEGGAIFVGPDANLGAITVDCSSHQLGDNVDGDGFSLAVFGEGINQNIVDVFITNTITLLRGRSGSALKASATPRAWAMATPLSSAPL